MMARVRKTYLPRGFTLIEMMVVVAIILILMGVVVAVGTQVKANAGRQATLAELKTLASIMKDYLDAGYPEPTVPTPWPYHEPIYTNASGANPSPPDEYEPTTGGITPNDIGNPKATIKLNDPNGSDPINWVKALRSVPEFAKKVNSLPQGMDVFYNQTSGNWEQGTNTVVLDQFNLPIRYVPSQHQTLGVSNTPVVRSGYFMSTGPDGMFATAIYPSKVLSAKRDDITSNDP